MKMRNRYLAVLITSMLLMTMFVSAQELPSESISLLALSDSQVVTADKEAITSNSLLSFPLADGYLIDSLALPSLGTNGSRITWESSNPNIIANDGTVKRHSTSDEKVTLTATYTFGSYSDTEQFTYTVASLRTRVAGMPAIMSTLHEEHFNDGIIVAPHVEVPQSATENGGKLSVSTVADTETHMRLYAKSDKTVTSSGDYFVEYNLMRERADYVQIRIYGDLGNIVSARWEDNGNIWYYNQGSWSTAPGNGDANYKCKMSFYFNFETQKYTMWMNNELLVENISFREENHAINHNDIYFASTSPNTLVVDSYATYIPRVETTDKITPIEYLVDEDFEDDNYQCTIIKNPTDPTGKYERTDGKYRVTRYDQSVARTYVRMTYGNPAYLDQSPTGVFGIEFDLFHEKSYAGFNVLDAEGNFLIRGSWRPGGVVYLVYATSPDAASGWVMTNYKVPNPNNTELHFEILYDCRRGVASVWVNDTLVADNVYSNPTATTYYYTEFYTDNDNYGTFSIDNYKLYRAMPPTLKRIDYDALDFSFESILREEKNGNFVTKDLNLMKELYYGTKVLWESSNPSVINPETGKVTRPSVYSGNASVTLTARLKDGKKEILKTFDVVVLADAATSDESIYADTNLLTYDLITDQNPNEIKTALNLIPKGLFGSDIVWKSSNPNVIATSGRVIRPRWDGTAVSVTLTATIGGKNEKKFDFIVKPDDKLKDPQKVSDVTFFGEYKNGTWTTTPYLDYDYPGMDKVGNAAKRGAYEEAKAELVSYMKNRPRKDVVKPAARSTQWVNFLASGIRDMQSGTHYRTISSIASSEYEKISVRIDNPRVSENGFKTFRLLAKYNDPVEISILGNTYPNETMRPKFVLYVNGVPRTYEATLASTVRCGKYMDTPQDTSELKVKMFGEFLGNETYQSVFRFDFNDLGASDSVTYGELQIYAKKSSPSAEPKEFYVVADNNSTWDQADVTWNDLLTVLHNYNGLVDDIDWYKVLHADVELLGQSCRFWGYPEMVSEYQYTKDEYYAYTAIKRMMDFTIDCSVGWYNTLSAGCRMDSWVPMFEGLLDSSYMDAEVCTAIMKAMYSTCADVLYYHNERGNWTQTEKLAMYRVFTLFPEFKRSEEMRKHVTDFYLNQVKIDFFPDGTYDEDTQGYNTYSYGMYLTIWRNIVELGYEVPKEFDEYILNAARAALWFRGPGGEIMGYGDTGHGYELTNQYTDVTRLHGDTELEYMDSRGVSGTQPSHTSKLFPDSSYAFMRSNWTKNANYLFTQVRGYIGAHGHADDNSYILYSKGRNLLVDAGFVTYTDGPDRTAATSAINHNTVEIDGQTQTSPNVYYDRNNVGTTHAWTTNSKYDFLSQTSRAYETIGNKHKRTTTFLKDDFVICSDYFEPTEKTSTHTYKQAWHTPHDSNTSFDFATKKFKTNYLSGANLMVLNADSDATLMQGSGCWSNSYGAPSYIPFGYYQKIAAGETTLDTVLIPATGNFDANVERLDTGVPTTTATALKIKSNHSGAQKTYYYLLNYETVKTEKTFGKYKSDAQMAVVSEGDKISDILSANPGSGLEAEKFYIKSDFNSYTKPASGVSGNVATPLADYFSVGDCGYGTYAGDRLQLQSVPGASGFAGDYAVSLPFGENGMGSDSKTGGPYLTLQFPADADAKAQEKIIVEMDVKASPGTYFYIQHLFSSHLLLYPTPSSSLDVTPSFADEWKKLIIELDYPNDTASIYYNDVLVGKTSCANNRLSDDSSQSYLGYFTIYANTTGKSGYISIDNLAVYKPKPRDIDTWIVLNNGTYVKNDLNNVIFKIEGGISDISISVENKICSIETSNTEVDASKIWFDFGEKISGVKINDDWKEFTQTKTAITVSNNNCEPPTTLSPIFQACESVETIINEYPAFTNIDGTKYITNNLNLEYAIDSNNVTYVFTSSNTDAVSSKGVITRQIIDTPVTITAVMTDANGESATKTFDYIVPGKYNLIGKVNLPKEGGIIKTETFGSSYEPDISGDSSSEAPIRVKNGIFSTDVNVQERAILFNPDFVQSSGKVAYELIFDFEKFYDGESGSYKFTGVMNFDLVKDKSTKVCGIEFLTGIESGIPVIKYGNQTFFGVVKITLVADRLNRKCDFYMNDELVESGLAFVNDGNIDGARMYFLNSGGNKGTYNYYSFRTYKIDETVYPAIMKGEEIFSNGGTVAIGENKVIVPVIATTDQGEFKDKVLVYAIYDGNLLKGIDVVEITLNQFAHRAFSAKINIAESLKNPIQKVFFLENMTSLAPVIYGVAKAQ